jgi:methyltransferase (TIGR00027 family)
MRALDNEDRATSVVRKGRGSNTAQFVALNRALGSLAPTVPGFEDPIAEHFLNDRWRKKVSDMRKALAAGRRKSPYPYWFRGMGVFNQFRKVVLDDALQQALPFEQLVVLGAGLDGRAWSLPGLESAIVFEVDHPETQQWKRDRARDTKLTAREVRFVGMDFIQDDLVTKLGEAGYDPKRSSFWLWEGVSMYLSPSDNVRTLGAVARLSSSGSHLAMTYMAKKNGKVPRSWLLAFLGEPARSAYTVEELAQVVAASGWVTESNTGIEDWMNRLTPTLDLTEKKVGLQWGERIWVGRRSH